MKFSNDSDRPFSRRIRLANRMMIFTSAVAVASWIGCASHPNTEVQFSASPADVLSGPSLLAIESPTQSDLGIDDTGFDLLADAPVTLDQVDSLQSRELSLDQCVELALANSEVMQKLGGIIVNSPQAGSTLYDPALNETTQLGPEAALSAFDAQVNTSFFYNRSERLFNNPFIGGGGASLVSNLGNARFELSKQTASGASFAARSLIDYTRSNAPANLFGSTYDIVNQLELRQPLARGRGALVNRIAGPNAQLGQYNGVLIGRIRSDISLADFEIAVRNLVRDVQTNYWELYFAYRNFDTTVIARDAARETWENRRLRFENEVGRSDDEALARQQYFNFKTQAQNALAGTPNGLPGVLGAERNLRRLMGLPTNDGTLIRPSTEPTIAPVAFDWRQAQADALQRRIELRRQKWTLKQRELELVAAKALNRWRFDLVGQYGWRGFGDNLFGSRSQETGSAFDNLTSGDLDDWQLGLELNGAIGNRRGHVAIRNAELNLVRERSILKEQQRQILHDLSAAYTEVDRAMSNVQLTFNNRVAVQEEIEPKRKRVAAGQDQVFFLLDAQQRLATSESAVHRAIADYNLALASFNFVVGNVLGRFNVHLTEGQWGDDARYKATRKQTHITPDGNGLYDLPAVSQQ